MTEQHHLPADSTERRPVRILYVEAHPEMRRLMLALLKCAGHPCAGVSSILEALNCVATAAEAFGLVIVAHQTPRVNGLALAKELRARRFPGRIMIYSMEFDETDEVDCKELGVDAVLRKPAPSELLFQKVTTLCDSWYERGESPVANAC